MGKQATAVFSMAAMGLLATAIGAGAAWADVPGAAMDPNGAIRRVMVSREAGRLSLDWENFSRGDLSEVARGITWIFEDWMVQRDYEKRRAEIERIIHKTGQVDNSGATELQPMTVDEFDRAIRDIEQGRTLLTDMADEIKPMEKVIPIIHEKLKTSIYKKSRFYPGEGAIFFAGKNGKDVLWYWSNRFYGPRFSHQWQKL